MRIFAFARSSASEEKEIPTVFFGFFSFIGSKLATFFKKSTKFIKIRLTGWQLLPKCTSI